MSAWNKFVDSSGQQKRSQWVIKGKERADKHTLPWLRDALRNAKLMDDQEEVRILGLAVHFREQLDAGKRVDVI